MASNGVHGANRLASNSLLEGLVYGARAARRMAADSQALSGAGVEPEPELFPEISELETRTIAWRYCGLVRNEEGLKTALSKLAVVMNPNVTAGRSAYELRNIDLVASLIAQGALARLESRGGHYRSDFPERSKAFEKHSRQSKGEPVVKFGEG